jgi:hypothetical protein
MRKFKKFFPKFLPALLATVLFFNSTMPGLLAIGDVLSFEGEETIEVLEEKEEIVEEEALVLNEEVEEKVLIEEIKEADVVEETVIEKEDEVIEKKEVTVEIAVEEEEVIEKEIVETWIVNGRSATTTLPVVLGETYVSPQNKDVTVTFTKLPSNPSTLSIQEFALNSEEVSATNAVFNLAYDITTDMVNGTFEYNLTLPLVHKDFEVIYSDDRGDLVNKEFTTLDSYVTGDVVRIDGLDHFTVFALTIYSNISLEIEKDKFSPGETIHLKGTNNQNENLILFVKDPNNAEHKVCEESNAKEIICSYKLDDEAVIGGWKALLKKPKGASNQWHVKEKSFEVEVIANSNNDEGDENGGNGEIGGAIFPEATDLPSGQTKLSQWADQTQDWRTGALNSQNSAYSEGETVPFRLEMRKVSSGYYKFSICRDYENTDIKGYLHLNPYNTSRSPIIAEVINSYSDQNIFAGINIDAILFNEIGGQGDCNAGSRETQVYFNVMDENKDTFLYWGGHLASPTDTEVGEGKGASQYPGGSLHMKLLSPSKDLSIQTSAIIPLGSSILEICKEDTNGTPLADWEMTLYKGESLLATQETENIIGDELETIKACTIFLLDEVGTYEVKETMKENWSPYNEDSITIEAELAKTYSHTFVNFEHATIEACKIDTNKSPVTGWGMTLYKVGYENDLEILETIKTLPTIGDEGCVEFLIEEPGQYRVEEQDDPNWTHISNTKNTFDVESGDEYLVTFTNFEHATIEACKIDTNESPIAGWNMTLYKIDDDDGSEVLNEISIQSTVGIDEDENTNEGCVEFLIEEPGQYRVEEQDDLNWTHISNTVNTFDVKSGDKHLVTFTNFENISATICKIDGEENPVGNWGIYFDDEYELTDEETGCVSFDITQPGTYTASEEFRSGWTALSPTSVTFEAISGENKEITFQNELLEPELLLTKSNNSIPTGHLAGDMVTFTLQLTAPEREPKLNNMLMSFSRFLLNEEENNDEKYIVENVKVVDVPSHGFEYVKGSWTANSSIRGDLSSFGEPTYASPGTWTLGDMIEGEVITLTYNASISSTQETGLHKDLAWAEGESLLGARVLGNSNTGVFVDTEVLVIEPAEELEEGEVLGVSTVVEEEVKGVAITLAQTGAGILLALAGLISLLIGFLLLTTPAKKKAAVLALTIFSLFTIYTGFEVNEAYAVTTSLNVKIAEPKTPTAKSKFDIGFVTLDSDGKNVTVECKESSYGTFQTHALRPGGDSGVCNVDEKVITKSGIYEFFVIAKTSSGSVTSQKVKVEVLLDTPSPVEEYEKTKKSCTYELNFTTPNEQNISKVQIFRSETNTFTADQTTLVEEISVTPNQKVTYTDTLPDCEKDFYYALRTLNKVNNTSSFVVDETVQVVQVEVPGAIQQAPAVAPAGVITPVAVAVDQPVVTPEAQTPAEDEEEGEILGERISLPECEEKTLLSGYVLFEEKGVEGVSITIYYLEGDEELEVDTVKTNSDGYWEIELCEGEYYTKVTDTPSEYEVDGEDEMNISVSKDEENTITYYLKEAEEKDELETDKEESTLMSLLPWIIGASALAIIVIYFLSKRKKY